MQILTPSSGSGKATIGLRIATLFFFLILAVGHTFAIAMIRGASRWEAGYMQAMNQGILKMPTPSVQSMIPW